MMIILIFETSLNMVIILIKGALICKINKRESIIWQNKIISQKDNSNYFQTHLSLPNKKSWTTEIIWIQMIWTHKMFLLFRKYIIINILIINKLLIKIKRTKKNCLINLYFYIIITQSQILQWIIFNKVLYVKSLSLFTIKFNNQIPIIKIKKFQLINWNYSKVKRKMHRLWMLFKIL